MTDPFPTTSQIQQALELAHRQHWPLVVSVATRVTGSLQTAEECAQDAYALALGSWARDGIPDRPQAWLVVAARRRAVDVVRRAQVLTTKLALLAEPEAAMAADEDFDDIADDRLRLVFTCCHPALALPTRAALTLRTVCGVSTTDVAKAFLVSEATMAARLTRARKKILAARIPYRVPGAAQLPDRLDGVLVVLHLLITTAHGMRLTDKPLADELAGRALLLARALVQLMPDEPEARGLLALLLLTQARSAARVSDGALVLLADQDRSTWNADLIAEGLALTPAALRGQRTGRYGLQAAIAAVHAEAPDWQATDWPQILGLYDVLLHIWPNPVVALNRAVAVAEVHGPRAGLTAVDEMANHPSLAGYPYLAATRADLLRRVGRFTDAAETYRTALLLTTDELERAFLQGRVHEVTADARSAS